ncbi:MAG: family 10 glycosylhydrolase [Cytophagales bacterium]|nr:family 10 glycosylhydrolase [Cytophagales bacterium]
MKNLVAVFFSLCLTFIAFGQRSSVYPKHEVRGLWVTTAYNLDWPSSSSLSAKEQKEEFIELLESHQDKHINTIFLQIRIAGDALYKSKYEPWSKVLTGKQGEKPEYDPLQFAIEECHKRNIELHAWLNIFRANNGKKSGRRSRKSLVKKQPKWFIKTPKGPFFNPGVPEVHDYLTKVVLDVVQNYDIDAIHFDDYFYPQEIHGVEIKDHKLWKKSNSSLSLEDWRRNNVDEFIHKISKAIKKEKPYVKFGISPAAIWRHKSKDTLGSKTSRAISSYDDLYGDSRKWLQKGWIDYLAPQLYQSTKYQYADFNTVLEWWDEQEFDHHLYIGHAIYKVGTKQAGWENMQEIPNQVESSREYEKVFGNAFFRAANFNKDTKEIEEELIDQFFTYKALVPPMPWIDSIPPNAPRNLYIKSTEKGNFLTWTAPKPAKDDQKAYRYLVYRTELNYEIDFEHPKYIISHQEGTSFLDTTALKNINYLYFVTAVDRLGNESLEFISGGVGTKKPKK